MSPRRTIVCRYSDERAKLAPRWRGVYACARLGCTMMRFVSILDASKIGLCKRCIEKGRAAAKAANLTIAARGSRIVARGRHGPQLPAWIVGDRDWLRTRRGFVLDARGIPLAIVQRDTLRLVSWVTPVELVHFWKRHKRRDGEQLQFGFTNWILSAEDVCETGVHPWEIEP